MLVETGRPADAAGREAQERACYDLLDQLNMTYLRADHEEAMTMEDCRAIDQALHVSICKNLFLCNRQKTQYYLLLIPGDKPFKTRDLSAQIHSARLSFGDEEAMKELLGLRPGSVSVLGLMNDTENRVSLLVDEELLNAEYIGAHPCRNTSSLKLSMQELTGIFLPAVHHSLQVVSLPRYAEEG